MANKNKNGDGGRTNFLVTLIQSSIILSALDSFSTYIYSLIKNGFFGYIFSGYHHDMNSGIAARIENSKSAVHFAEFRYGICRRIESSIIVNKTIWFMKCLLGCKLKVYGTFFLSFGVYSALLASVNAVLDNNISALVQDPYIAYSMMMIMSSLPLILSKKTLSEALITSLIGRFILKLTGFKEENIISADGDGGHTNKAFILGLAAGMLTYLLSPIYILGGIVAVIWAYLVLIRPELGVLTLFFAMPILPTMLLAVIVVYTTLCWFIKLFRGKRVLRIEPVDIMVLAFIVLMFFGGVISVSSGSLKPALLLVCLALGYILTVELITTREWLVRCSTACIVSASLVSLYGILMYFTGGGYSSDAWLDSDMFSSIGRRAVATLENPNMLGEYLILIIPIAVAMFIGRGEGLRRISSFICIGIMGLCLVLTWSRGAWLGLIFAAVVFLFMWHRRSVWLVFIGIASIPILPSILPASIVSRFTSIGDLADSSTSYRVYIWRAAVEMIGDNFLTGIGVGESAWSRLYPLYTYQGVESAPHSHNLFLQIWLELGLFGIVVFVVFLFMLFQAGFTFFAALSEHSELRTPDISENILHKNIKNNGRDVRSDMQAGKIQLRISTAGPLCGIIAVLVQGMTDYAWYNYRLYLMFWLVCGLAAAYIRNGRSKISNVSDYMETDPTSCTKEILVSEEKIKKNKEAGKKIKTSDKKTLGETNNE